MLDKEITLIIDRFEGSFAVCEQEDGGFQTIPRFRLPQECKEGDLIELKNDIYTINHDKTKSREKMIQEKLDSLFE